MVLVYNPSYMTRLYNYRLEIDFKYRYENGRINILHILFDTNC